MILVAGATGTIGSRVVHQLASAGTRVRALAHSADNHASLTRLAVDVAYGDFRQPSAIKEALVGVRRLFLVSPANRTPTIPELEFNVIEESRRAGLEQIVKLSVLGSGQSEMTLCRWHRKSEVQIESSGIPWTFLRSAFFMSNFATSMGATIRAQATFSAPAGQGRISMVDPTDIARCALAVLSGPGHEGKAYDITGADSVSLAEAARTLSIHAGKPITYVDQPGDVYRDMLLRAGLVPDFVEAYSQYWDWVKDGHAAAIATSVEGLTHRRPRSLGDWASDNASSLR